MKVFVIMLFLFAVSACQADVESGSQLKVELQHINNAVSNTPYSALIKHLSVDAKAVDDDDSIVLHVFHAKVIETYRGDHHESISYQMVVEKDETIGIDEQPFIVTLCQSVNGYYWPGTGAAFSNKVQLINSVKIAVKNLARQQTNFSDCE
ncbi:MAG: hypothetical protein V7677_18515 [Motiliproteus sp.]